MILVVVLTGLALAVIAFVIHVEDRAAPSAPGPRAGSRFEGLDATALAQVDLPRAVLGYEPVAVREALAAAARLAAEASSRAEAAVATGTAAGDGPGARSGPDTDHDDAVQDGAAHEHDRNAPRAEDARVDGEDDEDA